MDNQWEKFLRWAESSGDFLSLKRCYIDIADGDIIAGLLLSRIIWLTDPFSKYNKSLHYLPDGTMGIVKGRHEWWDECRITPKQFDRAIKILVKVGLVTTVIKKFDGTPSIFISLNFTSLLNKLTNNQKEG